MTITVGCGATPREYCSGVMTQCIIRMYKYVRHAEIHYNLLSAAI